MSNEFSLKRGFTWFFSSNFFSFFLKFFLIIIVSRILVPEDFGIISSIQIIVSFCDIIWRFGLGSALIRKKIITNIEISSSFVLNLLFAMLIFFFLLFFSPAISSYFNINSNNVVFISGIIIIINSLSGISDSLLQRDFQFKKISLINFYSLLFYFLSTLILVFLNFGYYAILLSLLFESIVKTLLFVLLKPFRLEGFSFSSSFSLINFGFGYTIGKLFNNFATQGDYFVVNQKLGNIQLGYYNRAYQILLLPTNLLGSTLDKLLFPIFSKNQDDSKQLFYYYFLSNLFIMFISFPLTQIVIAFGEEIVLLILGNQWLFIVNSLKILYITLFFRIAYKISDSLIRTLGRVYRRLWIQVVYAILILVGSLFGSRWGIVGVSITTSISIFLNYFLLFFYVIFSLKIDYINVLKSFFFPILLFFILTVISVLLLTNLIINTIQFGFLIKFIFILINILSFYISLYFLVPNYLKSSLLDLLKK